MSLYTSPRSIGVPVPVANNANAHALTAEAEYARLRKRRDAKGWASAADAWEGLRFVGNAAYARLRQAEAAVSGRQPREGAQALHAARRHTAALADEPVLLLRDIEGLARRARIDLRGVAPARRQQPADTDRFRLTPREREVLTQLVEGSTNRQIASALFITEKTASVHVSNIMVKLGVASRGQAAAAAHRLRLLQPPDADRFGLTPREREVLTLLVEGSTNRQIASALFITEKTASVHVSNIMVKLGVASRGQAAAAAHRLRLLQPAADGNS